MESTSINWKAFELKNDKKEQWSFECMSYMLFCAEHNNRIGLFRYKNQIGIETEPIILEGKICGFQSKYYSDSIATNKTDIIDSIKKAKSKNENIDELYFYINKEFSESSKKTQKKPKYQQEIEDEAEKLGLKIAWRVPSHLEIQLLLPENKYIYDIFFNLQPNESNLIDDIKEHNETILRNIKSEILHGDKIIRIDRQSIIDKIERNCNKGIDTVISGEGGGGKTAVFKMFYEKNVNKFPICVFKANELNVSNVNDIFRFSNNYSLSQFINIYKDETKKLFVIDSAEKLAEFENLEIINSLIYQLKYNSWNIIYTTRNVYLNDLSFNIKKLLQQTFECCNVPLLELDELLCISKEYGFNLPSNDNFKERLRNLFYLNEYLTRYNDINIKGTYKDFRDVLWAKHIKGTIVKNNLHIQREKCLIEIVRERCKTGSFYVTIDNLPDNALYVLQQDEIINYEESIGAYSITHDIYEEWALNVIVTRAFNNSENVIEFLETIGTTLPIRRAFRVWLSEQIIVNPEVVDDFLKVLNNNLIADYWKQEILVSILLSEYSSIFFKLYNKEIIADDFRLLKKIIFLLRIACVDLTIENNLEQVIPKGRGWQETISLIYKHKDDFFHKNINYVTPILADWCGSYKEGEITRLAGLLIISIIQKTETGTNYVIHSDFVEKILRIINDSAKEICCELEDVFEKVITNNWKKHNDPYYAFCLKILEKPYLANNIIQLLPSYLINLCDLCWTYNVEDDEDDDYPYGINEERHYGIVDHYKLSYMPASANQTPIIWLLQREFKETLEFIIAFTNKSIVKYSDSTLGKNDLTEITLHLDNLEVNQYISNAIWGMHRGVIGPVVPYLLQSIHMALEAYLLEMAEKLDCAIVKHILLIILKGAKSASLTSIVCSVVLAHPDKFYDIALLLSKTIEIFLFDNDRMSREFMVRGSIVKGLGQVYDLLYVDERLKTCEQKFRETSLETIILNYQISGIREFSENQNLELVNRVYSIIDEHKKVENIDLIRRALLSRIDSRNLKTKVIEEKAGCMVLEFEPINIDPDLQQKRIEITNNLDEMQKMTLLKKWAEFPHDSEDKNINIKEYDNNPLKAFSEAKQIYNKLSLKAENKLSEFDNSIPPSVCSKLLLYHHDILSEYDKHFCKKVILDTISQALSGNIHSVFDGSVASSFMAYPILLKEFKEEYKELILYMVLPLILREKTSYGIKMCEYIIESIRRNKMWEKEKGIADEVLLYYIKIKPIYDKIKLEHRKSNSETNQISNQSISEKFLAEINSLNLININYNNIDLNNLSFYDLDIILQLIPSNTKDTDHLAIYSDIIEKLRVILFSDDKKLKYKHNKITYSWKRVVFRQMSKFLLYRDVSTIDKYLTPLLESLEISEYTSLFISELIYAEDILCQRDMFWLIWDKMYLIMKDFYFGNYGYYFDDILEKYLLAVTYDYEKVKEWHSLTENDLSFYDKISIEMNSNPVVLCSIVKVLNSIASKFVNNGLNWIYNIISNNEELSLGKYEYETIYYLEILLRKYIVENKNTIKKKKLLRNKVITIFDFMINRGSMHAYLLRECVI